MKIKHVEELVGVTRKNIRFYEEQGLLAPGRAENGYREYTLEDVAQLKRIKLMRKLAVPIEQIRQVLADELPLADCLTGHLRALDRQQADLRAVQALTQELLAQAHGGAELAALDPEELLEQMERREREGRVFMNISRTDVHRKKTAGAALGAVIMIVLMAYVAGVMLWGNAQEPVPIGVLALIVGVPLVIIVSVIVVLSQRIREIWKGEEDEASEY